MTVSDDQVCHGLFSLFGSFSKKVPDDVFWAVPDFGKKSERGFFEIGLSVMRFFRGYPQEFSTARPV